jgi:hypothetical protein
LTRWNRFCTLGRYSESSQGLGFYGNDDSALDRRLNLLRIAKDSQHTDSRNHKVLKGPYHNQKSRFKMQNPEEEWGVGRLSKRQAVDYQTPVSFLNLAITPIGDLAADNDYVYFIFFADDSGNFGLLKNFEGDTDDIAAVGRLRL